MNPITESYIKYKGYCCSDMNDENVLLPFFLADSAYLIFDEHIKPLCFKQELKMCAKRFLVSYNRFTKDFFAAFDDEQKDYIVDKMDGLYSLVDEDVETFRNAIINHVAQFPAEVRQTLASLSALMHLTQCTWIVYRHLFSNVQSRELQGMMTSAHSLFQAYANKAANRINVAELNKVEAISSASRTLCDRILQFINLTKQQNELQKNEAGCGCAV